MKKHIFIFFILGLNFNMYSQVFQKTFNSKEFNDLQNNGIIYFKKGNNQDKIVEECLSKYWKVSKYKIIDPQLEKYNGGENDVILSQNKISRIIRDKGGNRRVITQEILCLFSSKYLNKEILSQLNTGAKPAKFLEEEDVPDSKLIGYISLDGYNQGQDPETINDFLPFSISGLNSCAGKIIQEKISGFYPNVNEKIEDAININAYKLKGKTIVIIDNTIGHVKTDELTKNQVNYIFISRDDYHASQKKYESSEYCILYFSHKFYLNISIFDNSDKNLIYTSFYNNADWNDKYFDKREIKKMTKYYITSK